ncbi:hypothetical protein L596_016074 [Steinernema carpocapsae]|uniref:G-protein coupled receptors family 1 profile domain-containing protein n=1 Tax=Steinernema carpocapsae TaxID=34508 RepID=A0A4U5NHI5_STECR|nr:hypothetical protein L596_016074 [Steinernema carpocapsae]
MNNASEVRVNCAPSVFAHEPVPQITVALINYFLFAVVLWASLKVDKNDLCRLYTLWLYCTHVPYDTTMLVISPLQMVGIVDNSGKLCDDGLYLIPIIGKFFQDIASHVYRILALLMVAMTYTSYTNPILFQRLFAHLRRSLIFFFGFVFIVIEVTISNTITLTNMEEINSTWSVVATILFYVLQVFGIGPIVFMMGLYTASIVSILRYTKDKAQRGESTKNQRRQLLSVVFYSTTPNILLLPIILINLLSIASMYWPEEIQTGVLGLVFSWTARIMRYCNYVRIPIITISTFAAFAPYRRVLLFRNSHLTRVGALHQSSPSVVSAIKMPRIQITRSSL